MACFVSTKIRHHRRRGMYIKTKTRHQWSQILVIKPQSTSAMGAYFEAGVVFSESLQNAA